MKFLIITAVSAITSISIIKLLKTSMLNRSWSYPLLLSLFPIFYIIFALSINDKSIMKNELLAGLLFFAIAAIYIRYREPWTETLLAMGFILHAVYDVMHDLLFTNMGVPLWWPEFCGTVDLFIGLYLLFIMKQKQLSTIK